MNHAHSTPARHPKRHERQQPGETTTTIQGEAAPKLPHEQDESSQSQSSPPREVMRQAQRDVQRGVVDTDKGAPMDELYHDEFRTDHPQAGAEFAAKGTNASGVTQKKASRE